MDISLGLPIADPDILITWARRAEARGFAALGLLDRLTYDNPEPMITLAALAGATSRIRLQTEVLLAPLRDTALLAKQAATLDRLTRGRFTLGVGVGGRDDDHQAAGIPLHTRGARLEVQLADLVRIWAGQPYTSDAGVGPGGVIGPRPHTPGGPPLLIGGFAPKALQRVARFADGYLCAAPPQWAGRLLDQVRDDWARHGRTGSPRLVCQTNAALGPEATITSARSAVADYYAFTGQADWSAPTTDPEHLISIVDGFRELGADEVVIYCYATEPDQVERLADLLLSP